MRFRANILNIQPLVFLLPVHTSEASDTIRSKQCQLRLHAKQATSPVLHQSRIIENRKQHRYNIYSQQWLCFTTYACWEISYVALQWSSPWQVPYGWHWRNIKEHCFPKDACWWCGDKYPRTICFICQWGLSNWFIIFITRWDSCRTWWCSKCYCYTWNIENA